MKLAKTAQKALAVFMSALVLGSAAVALPEVVPESIIKANAVQTYGDYEYVINNNEVTITKYKGDEADVTIPSTINGKKSRV